MFHMQANWSQILIQVRTRLKKKRNLMTSSHCTNFSVIAISLASFPGPTQLSITRSTESHSWAERAWEWGYDLSLFLHTASTRGREGLGMRLGRLHLSPLGHVWPASVQPHWQCHHRGGRRRSRDSYNVWIIVKDHKVACVWPHPLMYNSPFYSLKK